METRVAIVALMCVVVVSAATIRNENPASSELHETLKSLHWFDNKTVHDLHSIVNGGCATNYDVPEEAEGDADFIRAITAYVTYERDFKSKPIFDETSQDYDCRFSMFAVAPCQHTVEILKEPISSALKIKEDYGTEGSWIEKWASIVQMCEKLISKREEFSKLSFKVAEMNKDKKITI